MCCVSQVMEKKQYQVLKSGGCFCKIPLPCFASDLACGWRAIDIETKDQGRASDLLQMFNANLRLSVTQNLRHLAKPPSLHLPQAGRKMGRIREITVMLCTGHREICKNMYFVSLQLISILGTYATKWQCYDNDKCLNATIRIHYNHKNDHKNRLE